MNTEEVTMLLTRIQVIDNRQVDQLTIEAWEPLLTNTDYEDAVEAVNTHFRTSENYLQPVHVVQGAKLHREKRIRRQSELAHRRIIELGGEKPAYWNGALVYDDELAAIGHLIETHDPRADDAARQIVAEQQRRQAEIEAGDRWIKEHGHELGLTLKEIS